MYVGIDGVTFFTFHLMKHKPVYKEPTQVVQVQWLLYIGRVSPLEQPEQKQLLFLRGLIS